MPPEIDPTAPAGADGNAPTGTEPAAAEDPTAKLIEDYRKRQAGAEKARQEAERARDEALRQLADATSAKPSATGTDGQPDLAAIKRELQADFDKKLSEQTAKITGDALDARFPVARKKFPTVTDAIQLAELEGLFSEPEQNPTPVGNSPQRQAAGTQKNIEDMTSKELQAYMKSLPPEAAGLETDR